jgi:cysteine desulfurase
LVVSESRLIYLDNNATTQPLPAVLETLRRCSWDCFANPGSRHAAGRKARQILEESRERFAGLLGSHPDEVIFTSGGTEANNLAVLGRLNAGEPGVIVTTAGEHPAVLEACHAATGRGHRIHFLRVDSAGRIDPSQIDALPWPDVRLVAVILAHNETGVIQDVSKLAAECGRNHVPLHLDALQAVGKIPVNFRQLDAGSLAVGAHKFHGPRGVGALLLRRGDVLRPISFGGHQESDRRPGTECVPLIAAMVTALERFVAEADARIHRMTTLRDRLEAGLAESCPPVVVNGREAPRLPNTANVAFPGVDGDALLVALDLAGVACSLGSACASGSSEPAPALVAMNAPRDVLASSIRFSLGIDTTTEEIDAAVAITARLVQRMRSRAGAHS